MNENNFTELRLKFQTQYDFIPYANWEPTEKGPRPAPYGSAQKYPDTNPYWEQAQQDRVGIRLDDLVLVDYDGNKPEAIGEIPSPQALASALGYVSQQEMFDKALVQWNDELTSLHFLFRAPAEFNTTEFKQSNQGTDEFFWKHIDIKTGNQLVYLKNKKHQRLFNRADYDQAPPIIIEQLRDKSEKTLAEDFDYTNLASEYQQQQAEEWLHESLAELTNTESGSRNATLNITACTASGLVAGGALNNQASYTLMFDAAIAAGLDRSETIATLNSGWAEGQKTPRKDAPYRKPSMDISEVFAEHQCNDTNIDTKADHELTKAVCDGILDESDPNIGILHQQYLYFLENWVMNREGRFIDKRTLTSYSKSAFETLHINMMPMKPGSKTFKRFSPAEVFDMANPTVVDDLFYMPGGEDIVTYERKTYLNSYFPYEPERPSNEEIQHVTNTLNAHLVWLFDDPIHRQFMLDWMAWQVQHPGELVGWVPLVIGCLGDGKSIMFEMITAAIGSQNTKLTGNKSIQSDFQDWAANSATTAFEELRIEGKYSRQVANDMKPFITEKRVAINGKGSKEATIPNFTNYIAFSNYSDPILIVTGDRRWFILHTNHFGKNSVAIRTQTDMKNHFDTIKNFVNDEKWHPAVHWALREYVITPSFWDHRFRAPMTVFGEELVAQTASEKENRLEEYLENAHFTDGRTGRLVDCPYGFQIQDFRPIMPENWFAGMDKKPSAIMLGKWLRNLGYEQAKRQHPCGNWFKTYLKV